MAKTNFLFLLLLLTQALTAQQKWRNKAAESEITYTMKHLLHTWSGTSKQLTCIMETDNAGNVQKVAALVKISSFDSKNSNRDSHMLEVTEALLHPNISFESVSVTRLENSSYKIDGKLSFHGVQKLVQLMMTETKNKNGRLFSGSFIFLLEDFKVDRPTFMMVKTENEVKVDLKIAF